MNTELVIATKEKLVPVKISQSIMKKFEIIAHKLFPTSEVFSL